MFPLQNITDWYLVEAYTYVLSNRLDVWIKNITIYEKSECMSSESDPVFQIYSEQNYKNGPWKLSSKPKWKLSDIAAVCINDILKARVLID